MADEPDGIEIPHLLSPIDASQSILHGLVAFLKQNCRDRELAKPSRQATLDWLVTAICAAGYRSRQDVLAALIAAIPHGEEVILDEGWDYLFAVDEAALCLGIDPSHVRLAPSRLDS